MSGKNIKKFSGLIISNYRIVLLFILLITLPLVYSFKDVAHVSNIDIFFDKDDSELLLYKRFQKTYGNEEIVAIVFKDRDIFTEKNIDIIRDITKKIEGIEGVQRLFSLTNTDEAVGYDDTIRTVRVIPEGKLNPGILANAKKRGLSNHAIVDTLISGDGTTTAIIVEIKSLERNEKVNVVQKIQKMAEKAAEGRVKLHFGGSPVAEVEMRELSRRDMQILTPLMFLMVFFIVLLMLKNMALSLLSQLNVFLALVWSIGLFVACGEKFNMVTSIMGAILVAIAVADSIHLLSQYREEYAASGGDHRASVERAVRHVWLPCLFTSLTTGVGFFAFITSHIRPVKVLGVATAAGVMIGFIITVTFLPASLLLIKKRLKDHTPRPGAVKNSSVGRLGGLISKTGALAVKKHRIFVILLFVILCISGAGIYRIKFETNLKNYLPEKNRVRSDSAFIEENFGGTIPFVILVKPENSRVDFTHPKSLSIINRIQEDLLRDVAEFTSALSIANYFREMNRAFNNGSEKYYTMPESRVDILDFYEIGDQDIISRVMAPDYMEARISLQIRNKTNEGGIQVYFHVVNYLKKILGDDFSFKITGISSLYVYMTEMLKYSQMKSFTLAFVIIFFMMIYVCRNIFLAAVCMIPNLLPIAMTLGIMGWWGIPLDVATVMIASVTLGIAVDDTIHFVVWLKSNIADGMAIEAALLKTFRDVGKPIVITTVALVCGFFILMLGSTIPIRTFGVLTGLSLFFALLGDLIFLPAILVFFKADLSEKKWTLGLRRRLMNYDN